MKFSQNLLWKTFHFPDFVCSHNLHRRYIYHQKLLNQKLEVLASSLDNCIFFFIFSQMFFQKLKVLGSSLDNCNFFVFIFFYFLIDRFFWQWVNFEALFSYRIVFSACKLYFKYLTTRSNFVLELTTRARGPK